LKFLFVGLGNIGAKYAGTRHNIGFDVVDVIAEEFGAVFITSRLGDYADFRYRGKTIILLKPSTYMNLSGRAFKFYTSDRKIPIERTLTIVDDLSLPYGKIRMRAKGSHAGHNGLRNIEQEMQTSKYPRLKFGIGNNFRRGKQIDHVLGHWTNKEEQELASYIEDAKQAALSFVAHGLTNTMNQFNSAG